MYWCFESIVKVDVMIVSFGILRVDHKEIILEFVDVLVALGFGKLFLAEVFMGPTGVADLIKAIIVNDGLFGVNFFLRNQHSISSILRVVDLLDDVNV